MLPELQTIKTKLEKVAPKLAKKYGLDFLVIFGSYARGKMRKNSDIDIGFMGKVDFHNELELAGVLSDLLKTNHLDLVNLGRASPFLSNLATHEALLIYEKEKGTFADFRSYAFKRSVETKFLRDLKFGRTLDYVRKYQPSLSI